VTSSANYRVHPMSNRRHCASGSSEPGASAVSVRRIRRSFTRCTRQKCDPSRQAQDDKHYTAKVAKTPPGNRTDYRSREAGPRHAALLAQRANRRRVTRSVVRGGLQPALAVARHRPPGACARIFCSRVAALPAQRLATNLARAPHNHLRWGSTTATDRPLGSVRERNRILQVGLNKEDTGFGRNWIECRSSTRHLVKMEMLNKPASAPFPGPEELPVSQASSLVGPPESALRYRIGIDENIHR